MQEQILAKLYEVNDLLELAKCDGVSIIADRNVYADLKDKLGSVIDAVEYYVD